MELAETLRALSAWLIPPGQTGLGLERLPPAVLPFAIFALRTADLTLATWRMLAVVQGRRLFVWVTGFLQAVFFLTAVAGVLSQLGNLWNLAGYSAGFATGNVVGIWMEARFGAGHSLLRAVSRRRGGAVAAALHAQGLGATEITGRGPEGTESTVLCYVPRRRVDPTRDAIVAADPEAFVSVEEVRRLGGGWRA